MTPRSRLCSRLLAPAGALAAALPAAAPSDAQPISPPPQAAPEPPAAPGGFAPRSRYTLDFAPGQEAVGATASGALDRIARRLASDSRLRVQLAAYAGGPGIPAGAARRLSLTRALAVRSYLIDKGVSSTRIDLRALGHRAGGGAPDRVDATVSRR